MNDQRGEGGLISRDIHLCGLSELEKNQQPTVIKLVCLPQLMG